MLAVVGFSSIDLIRCSIFYSAQVSISGQSVIIANTQTLTYLCYNEMIAVIITFGTIVHYGFCA